MTAVRKFEAPNAPLLTSNTTYDVKYNNDATMALFLDKSAMDVKETCMLIFVRNFSPTGVEVKVKLQAYLIYLI